MQGTILPQVPQSLRAFSSYQKQQFGFTLIELIVTVGIISILVGVGGISYQRFRQNQVALTTALEVQQFVRTAQLKARVKDTPNDAPNDCTGLTGYTVGSDGGNGARIWYVPVCESGSADETEDNVPPNVFLDEFEITFATLGGGTDLAGNRIITIQNTNTPRYIYSFTVTPGGSISEPIRQ